SCELRKRERSKVSVQQHPPGSIGRSRPELYSSLIRPATPGQNEGNLAARCCCPAYFGELPSFSGWERVPRSERYRHRHRRLQRINPCRLTTKPLGVR